jgi:hypothetical protein
LANRVGELRSAENATRVSQYGDGEDSMFTAFAKSRGHRHLYLVIEILNGVLRSTRASSIDKYGTGAVTTGSVPGCSASWVDEYRTRSGSDRVQQQ